MAKNPNAVNLGRAGGKARAAKMSKADRSESARLAAEARWKDHKPSPKPDKRQRNRKKSTV